MASEAQAVVPDLSMPHITQSIEDAKKAIDKRVSAKAAKDQAEAEADNDPKLKEKYTFDFSYTDRQGKRWAGKFTNKALTVMDRQRMANIQAGWQMGLRHDAYDPDAAFLNEMLAHMAISLQAVEGSGAFSVDELRGAHDLGVVHALYEEVIGHEATFHRSRAYKGAREKGGGE